MLLELLKEEDSVIYKRVLPGSQILFFIMIFVRYMLDNTKYEILGVWGMTISGSILAAMFGTRELFIRGNKGMALFYYLLCIGYAAFMIIIMFF